jgi:hypothetical protein
MKLCLEHPYSEFKAAYLVINKEPRRNVILVRNDNTKTVTSYARFLMSIHLGRTLEKYEHVDHIDGNRMNDQISNYQILTRRQNNQKSSKGRKSVKMICPNCGRLFEKELNKTHLQKGGKFTSCSMSCKNELLKKGYSIADLTWIGKAQIHAYFIRECSIDG